MWRTPLLDTLRSRIKQLLATQQVEPEQFFKRMGWRTASWRSEFLAGKRTTNDLRKVIKASRFFKVPVGYLIGEKEIALDAETTSMLGAWEGMEPRCRRAVLRLALDLVEITTELSGRTDVKRSKAGGFSEHELEGFGD